MTAPKEIFGNGNDCECVLDESIGEDYWVTIRNSNKTGKYAFYAIDQNESSRFKFDTQDQLLDFVKQRCDHIFEYAGKLYINSFYEHEQPYFRLMGCDIPECYYSPKTYEGIKELIAQEKVSYPDDILFENDDGKPKTLEELWKYLLDGNWLECFWDDRNPMNYLVKILE